MRVTSGLPQSGQGCGAAALLAAAAGLDVLAVGIVGTTHEGAATAALAGQPLAALGAGTQLLGSGIALGAGGLGRLVAEVLAVRVAGAAGERAALALAHHQRAPAVGAGLAGGLGRRPVLLDVLALGVAGAARELAEAALADHQPALLALRARLAGVLGGDAHPLEVVLGLLQRVGEGRVPVADGGFEAGVPILHPVQP